MTDATPKQEELRITVAVTKRAFSVFKSMFPDRDLEDRSNTVGWEQSVLAMGEVEVGFMARQSTGRAEFRFRPNDSSKWFG